MKRQLLIDFVGVVGFAALELGLWMIGREYALITGGILMMAFAARASR